MRTVFDIEADGTSKYRQQLYESKLITESRHYSKLICGRFSSGSNMISLEEILRKRERRGKVNLLGQD